MARMTEEQARKRRRDINIGLANNAFGAAAGAYGTRAVYQQARAKHLPRMQARYEAKQAAKQARRAAKGPTALSRAGAKIGNAIPAKVRPAIGPALVAGAVGSQLVNAGADAQSAAFFAAERAKLGNRGRRKESENVRKFDDGFASGVEFDDDFGTVNAKNRQIRKESWRQKHKAWMASPEHRRKAIYQQGLVAAGGVGAMGAGAEIGRRRLKKMPVPLSPAFAVMDEVPAKDLAAAAIKRGGGGKKVARKVGRKAALPVALIGGGAYATRRAHRAAKGEIKRPWF